MAVTEPHHGRDRQLDRDTLLRAQQGHRRARRRLIEHYAPAVFHLLSRLLSPAGRGGLVEDLAQETMLRVVQAIGRFDPDGPAKLSTWILTIASRLALQELQRRRPTTVSMPEVEPAGPDFCSPEDHVATGQLRRRVAHVVATLSPSVRAAFVLSDAHGLTPSEVAEALEIPPATARTRIHRARQQIRHALGEDAHDD